MNDERVLRERLAVAAGRRAPTPGPGPDGAACLVQTKAVGAYPTLAASYFAATPLRVGGAEVEGGAAVFSPAADGQVVVVFNLGSKAPPIGTKLIAHSAGGRWVTRYDG